MVNTDDERKRSALETASYFYVIYCITDDNFTELELFIHKRNQISRTHGKNKYEYNTSTRKC